MRFTFALIALAYGFSALATQEVWKSSEEFYKLETKQKDPSRSFVNPNCPRTIYRSFMAPSAGHFETLVTTFVSQGLGCTSAQGSTTGKITFLVPGVYVEAGSKAKADTDFLSQSGTYYVDNKILNDRRLPADGVYLVYVTQNFRTKALEIYYTPAERAASVPAPLPLVDFSFVGSLKFVESATFGRSPTDSNVVVRNASNVPPCPRHVSIRFIANDKTSTARSVCEEKSIDKTDRVFAAPPGTIDLGCGSIGFAGHTMIASEVALNVIVQDHRQRICNDALTGTVRVITTSGGFGPTKETVYELEQ